MSDEQRLLEMVLDETGKIVEPETPLDTLNLDSLEFVSLMKATERIFGCTFSDAAIIRINKIGDILTEVNAVKTEN